MKSRRRKIRGEGILPFITEEIEGATRLTSYAGAPLIAEVFRASGAAEATRRCVRTGERYRKRGLAEDEIVESFCLLLALGGECLDDFRHVGVDSGLAELIGHAMPSPTRAKQFLYAFHDEEDSGPGAAPRGLFGSYIPPEGACLEGLHEVLRATVLASVAAEPASEATMDLDATIVESHKREAAWTYKGRPGYQPTVALWAERDLVLADEFRDGNVPAGTGVLRVLKQAVETLPPGMESICVRSDSAGYTHDVLNWCRDEIAGRPPITFAISADMSKELRAKIEALSASAWRSFPRGPGDRLDERRHWAEVEFIPDAPSHKKGRRPDRYLAIRILPRQGELFADGSEVKYFAVVTNDWKREGSDLIAWHRQKAGTIEHTHDVLKNELGAGTMPCGRFGANAAWFRLNALTYNLLSLLRRTALPKELSKAKPKRLRLRALCVAGEVLHHARSVIVRVAGMLIGEEGLLARARLALRRLMLAVARMNAPPAAAG